MSSDPPIKRQCVVRNEDKETWPEIIRVYLLEEQESVSERSQESAGDNVEVNYKPPPVDQLLEEENQRADVI